MSAITYIRAGISTLPIIGPIIGLWNLHSVEKEIHNIQGWYFKPSYAVAHQKGRLYALAGLVGNITTLILKIRFIIFSILPLGPFVQNGIFFACIAYEHHIEAKAFQQKPCLKSKSNFHCMH